MYVWAMNTRLLYWALPVLLSACGQSAETRQQSPAPEADSLAFAIQNMRTDLAIQPGNTELRTWLANALIEHKEYAAADSQAAILAGIPGQMPQAHYIRGLLALRQGDTLKTIEHLTAAIQMRKDSSEYEAVMITGDIFAARNKHQEAAGYYSLAARIDSLSAEAAYLAGESLDREKNPTAARKQYQEAIRRDPAYAPAYLGLGNQLANAGNWREAMVSYNMAAKADPTSADAFYRRGKALLKLGNKDAGLDDLTKALSFRKNFPEAQHLLDSAKKM